MLDIAFIRENKDKVAGNAHNKGVEVNLDRLLELDEARRSKLSELEKVRAERNEHTQSLKGAQPNEENIAKGRELRETESRLEGELQPVEAEFATLLSAVPNMALDEVPVGLSENDNVVVKTVGEPPKFDFEPKNHAEIAEAAGWLDKERAANVAGSRFAYLKGNLVNLHWALMRFGMDCLGDENFLKQVVQDNNLDVSTTPFTPVLPPLMIRTEIYQAMDRLEPAEDRYKIDVDELWLQGSAEHVVGSMHAGEILNPEQLPLRYAGYATSFRREAGSYGKDMEGIFRLHQFDKLEMVSLTNPDQGLNEHRFIIAIQEALMQKLGLSYQLINKATADIGKPNASGWDINTWLPGQNAYRESHTADYMTDYQARRLKTRVRGNDGVVRFVHNNDATGFAQRTLIGIIENYQTAEGRVNVPEVLQPYMGGEQTI